MTSFQGSRVPGFRVWDLSFRVWGSGFRVFVMGPFLQGLGLGAKGSRFRVWGLSISGLTTLRQVWGILGAHTIPPQNPFPSEAPREAREGLGEDRATKFLLYSPPCTKP